RNRAVTAKQSARPPTSDASAVVRRYPSQGYCDSLSRDITKMIAATTRTPSASAFILDSSRRRTASLSSGGGGVIPVQSTGSREGWFQRETIELPDGWRGAQ